VARRKSRRGRKASLFIFVSSVLSSAVDVYAYDPLHELFLFFSWDLELSRILNTVLIKYLLASYDAHDPSHSPPFFSSPGTVPYCFFINFDGFRRLYLSVGGHYFLSVIDWSRLSSSIRTLPLSQFLASLVLKRVVFIFLVSDQGRFFSSRLGANLRIWCRRHLPFRDSLDVYHPRSKSPVTLIRDHEPKRGLTVYRPSRIPLDPPCETYSFIERQGG